MPGIANRTVPRLRAQPGSLLSLLPVRNVKDQPVGGSRREQTHTHTRVHTHLFTCTHTHTHTSALVYISTHITMHTHIQAYAVPTQTTQTHRDTATLHPHSGTNTSSGSLRYHITRAPARPSHEASAEMIQGSPLGPHSISQVELHTRMTAQLQHSTPQPLNVEMNLC